MFGRSSREGNPATRRERALAAASRNDQLRAAVVACILSDPLSELTDPAVLGRLRSGIDDVTFDELGLDSLARLTLAVRLDTEHGYALSESDVVGAGSVTRLAALLASLPSPGHEGDGETPTS
jgi:acyl carrier protein